MEAKGTRLPPRAPVSKGKAAAPVPTITLHSLTLNFRRLRGLIPLVSISASRLATETYFKF